jgi:hypothetical protein
MSIELESEPSCPYCGQRLSLVPSRWYGRAVLTCEQCGDFPDYSVRTPLNHAANRIGRACCWWTIRPRTSKPYRSMLRWHRYPDDLHQGGSPEFARSQPFDAIVLDVLMPGMDGWEVCRRLKEDPRLVVPFVMLTSLDAVDVPARARQLGAAAVLMKPCRSSGSCSCSTRPPVTGGPSRRSCVKL